MTARSASPLNDLRILDLTTFLSGPYATQILADLGADVVKVEPPTGDSSRSIPPHVVDGDSAYFHAVNRNKRSVVADLKTEQGRDLLRRLAAVADVLIENYRPGVLERLGLRYDDVAETNPGLVWCSISGFGQDGPYRERAAYDMIVQAISGGMSLTGMPDGPSVRSGIPLGDLAAGMYAVIGILAGTSERSRTGHGRRIDVSMLDCQISMLSYQGVYHLLAGAQPGHQGRAHDSIPTYRAFTAADGVDVMVTANTDRMWRSLCCVAGVPELVDDPRFTTAAERRTHRDQLDPLLEDAFRQRPASTWLTRLHAAQVPAAPVNSVAEALADPQVTHRNMVVDVPAERTDGEPRPALRLLGNPVKFPGSSERGFRRPPRLDEHAEQIDAEWLAVARPPRPGPQKPTRVAMTATSTVSVKDHETTLVDSGDPLGEPVVLVHSAVLDHRVWSRVIDELPGRVLAYDLRGHGSAAAAAPIESIDQLADDLAALLDVVGVHGAHLVGLSLGGAVVQRFAALHPDRVLSLALVATALRFPEEPMRERARALTEHTRTAVTDSTLCRWLRPRTVDADTDTARYAREHLATVGTEHWSATWNALAGFDATNSARHVSVPVLSVAGNADTSTPPAVLQQIAAAHTLGSYAEIEGATHIVALEAPTELGRILTDFLTAQTTSNERTPS